MKQNIIIAGSSGSIGGEFTKQYTDDPNVEKVVTLSRNVNNLNHEKIQAIKIDYSNEATFKNLDEISKLDSISKVIIATGILHTDQIKPEKSIDSIAAEDMKQVFQVNVFGPILLVKKLIPLIKKSKGVKIVFLTARVGSISDNTLGGWYSYRSSKTALNQIVKNFSIELKRTNKNAIALALQPGTVESKFSEPFKKNVSKNKLFTPDYSVELLSQVIEGSSANESGSLLSYDGEIIKP